MPGPDLVAVVSVDEVAAAEALDEIADADGAIGLDALTAGKALWRKQTLTLFPGAL